MRKTGQTVLLKGNFIRVCFSYQRIVQISIEKQLDSMSPIASREGSVPDFLRKPIATCDFPGGADQPPPLALLWIRPYLGVPLF